jgi:hypothetical protein
MSTSADHDDHTEKGGGVQIDESSMYNSESQLDDDCVSENSFGSHFGDDAMPVDDEENMAVYSDEEYLNPFQSTSTIDDTYVRCPSVDQTVVPQYTPPTRTQTRSTSNGKFSGPSMCVVRGLIFNPALILID